MKLKKDIDYIIKDLGLYKYVELKFQPDRFYFISETDSSMKIFNVLVVLKHARSLYRFKVLNANIGMPDELMKDHEIHAFPSGRSRSKYLNAILFFNYLDLKNVDYNTEICNSVGSLYYTLSQITKISSKKLSDGKIAIDLASYFNDLFEYQLMGGNVFTDSEFEKGDMIPRKSLRFFLNSLYIYNKEINYVNRIEWEHDGDKILINVIYNNGDKFKLTGLKLDTNNANKDDVLNIQAILFYSNLNESSINTILSKKIGFIEKY